MGVFRTVRPDGECRDGPDPPLYPERKEPKAASEEELRGLLKKQSERRLK